MPIGLSLPELATIMTPATSPSAGQRTLGQSIRGLGGALERAQGREHARQVLGLDRARAAETARANVVGERHASEELARDRDKDLAGIVKDAGELWRKGQKETARSLLKAWGLELDEQQAERALSKPAPEPPPETAVPPQEDPDYVGAAPEEEADMEISLEEADALPPERPEFTSLIEDLAGGPREEPEPEVMEITPEEAGIADAPPPTTGPQAAPARPGTLVTDPRTGRQWAMDLGADQDAAMAAVEAGVQSLIAKARPEDKAAAEQVGAMAKALLPSVGYDPDKAMQAAMDVFKATADRASAERRAQTTARGQSARAGTGTEFKLHNAVEGIINRTQTQKRTAQVTVDLANAQKIAAMATSGVSMQERMALAITLKAMTDSRPSDKEMGFAKEAAGKVNQLGNALGAWIDSGHITDEYLEQMRATAKEMVRGYKRHLHNAGMAAVEGIVGSATLPMGTEQRKEAARNAYRRITGFRMKEEAGEAKLKKHKGISGLMEDDGA